MCFTACHLTKVVILLIKSTVSFVKRTIAFFCWVTCSLKILLYNWYIYISIAICYSFYTNHFLHFPHATFDMQMQVLLPCVSFFLSPPLSTDSLTPPLSLASAAQSEILDVWDKLYDWSQLHACVLYDCLLYTFCFNLILLCTASWSRPGVWFFQIAVMKLQTNTILCRHAFGW